MDPSLPAWQLTFCDTTPLAVSAAAGWVTVTEAVAVHPLASVMVTVYVPAARFPISWMVSPLLHAYVYGAVPPPADELTEPSLIPLQLALAPDKLNDKALGSEIVAEVPVVHPLTSVTVAL